MTDMTQGRELADEAPESGGLPLGKLGAGLLILLLLGSLALPQTRALWLLELARQTGGDTREWCVDQLVALEDEGVAPLVLLSAEELDRAHDPGVATGVAPMPDSIPYPPTLNRLTRLAKGSAEVRFRLASALADGAPLVAVSLALLPHVRRVPADASRSGAPPLEQALAKRWIEHKEERPALLRLAPWLMPLDRRPYEPVPSELLERPCRFLDIGIPAPKLGSTLPGTAVAEALRSALGEGLTFSPAMHAELTKPSVAGGRESTVREMLRAFGGSDELSSALGADGEPVNHTFYRGLGTPTVNVFRDGNLQVMTEAETAPLWDALFRRLATDDGGQ